MIASGQMIWNVYNVRTKSEVTKNDHGPDMERNLVWTKLGM